MLPLDNTQRLSNVGLDILCPINVVYQGLRPELGYNRLGFVLV
jgi:hypothetical protein